MRIDKKEVKRILLITLTNIGDIILTTPVISVLDKHFPEARLDIMVGPSGKDIFNNHPRIFKVIIYDKHLPLFDKRRFVKKLRSIKYDLVVDLKNTLFPMLIGSKYRTSPIQIAPQDVMHKKESHLWKLKALGLNVDNAQFFMYTTKKDEEHVDRLLETIQSKDNFVVISPTSRSLIKRWKEDGFLLLSEKLAGKLALEIVMIGDKLDREVIEKMTEKSSQKIHNFAGMTSIPQLACLLKKSKLLITNDSAPMHVGIAAERKVLAIFGPTDHRKYGPRGEEGRVVRKELDCSPCESARCKSSHECMKLITVDEVYNTAREMLT